MTSSSHEEFVVQATVAGVNKFLSDAKMLQGGVGELRRSIETPVKGGFDQTIAQLRQMQTAIAAIEAQRNYQKAYNASAGAETSLNAHKASGGSGEEYEAELAKLRKEAVVAEDAHLAAERRLTGALAAYQQATEKRATEMSKPLQLAADLGTQMRKNAADKEAAELAQSEAEQRRISLAWAKDLGRQLRARVAADDQAIADAEKQQRRINLAWAKDLGKQLRAEIAAQDQAVTDAEKQQRQVNLAWARDLGKQLRAHAAAEEQARKDAEASARSRSRSTTRLNIQDIVRSVRAQKAEADAQEKRAADAIKAAERLGVLYRQEVAKQEKAASQVIPEDRIAELAGRGTRDIDISSVGRLNAARARQQIALEKADAAEREAQAQARTGVNDPAAMDRRLAELAQRRYDARAELTKTEELLAVAQRKRATLEESEALAAGQGAFGRARSNFLVGFKGASDVPYMQQAGQAAKFSVLYGSAYKALFAITQTFQASVQEGIQFQQGLSDMAVATGRPKEELKGLANRLAAISSDAGADPAAGLQIGARSVGLYGTGNQSQDQQAYVAELSTRVVSKMAMGTKVDPVTLQQNIAAVTQALGLGAGGQIRVADLDQYYSKKFGSGVGDTLEAAAQSSSVGIAAGFTPEQIQGLASVMIGRTGQSSNAVGGYLAQIFSRGGEGSLTKVAGKYGVDTTQPLAQQFAQLSEVYNNASQNQQGEISAAFGRGKVQNAVVAALQSWNEVAAEAKKAQNGAADGSLDTAFAERVGNIGGQLELLTGDLKEFAHLFGESGLLAVLGVGIEVLDKTVSALNTILGLYNQMPAVLRDLIAVLITTAAVGKFTGAGSLAKDAMNGVIPVGLARRAGIGGIGGVSNVLNEAGEVTAVRVGSDGIKAAGKAALATIGPWAAAGAGLLAIADVAKTMQEDAELRRNTVTALNQQPGYNATPDQLRNYASQLKTQAKLDRGSGDWFTQAITLGHGNDDSIDNAKMLEKEAKRIRAMAAEQDNATGPQTPSLFTGFDAESIKTALDQVTARGGTAAERVKALSNAISGLGEAAVKQATKIDSKKIAGTLAEATRSVYDDPQLMGGTGIIMNYSSLTKPKIYDKNATADMRAQIAKALPPDKIVSRLDEAKKQFGVDNFDDLTAQNAQDIADYVTRLPAGLSSKYIGLQADISKQMKAALLKQKALLVDAAKGTGTLSTGDVVDTLDALKTEFSGRSDARGQTDYAGRIRDAKGWIAQIKRTKSRAEDQDIPRLNADLAEARSRLASDQINRLEALRKVAVQNATSQKQATRIGAGFVRREISAAVKSGDSDLLVQVIELAGKEAIAEARAAINAALRVAVAARKNAAAIENAARAAAIRRGGGNIDPAQLPPSHASDKPSADERALRRQKRALDGATHQANPDQYQGEKDPKDSAAQINAARAAAQAALGRGGAVSDARQALIQARADLHDAKPHTVAFYQALAAERNAERDYSDALSAVGPARMSAKASRLGGQIAPARAAMAQAKDDLSKTTKGTAEYYQVLGQMFEARQQFSDALAAYGRNVRSLRIDATDPVAVARLELQEARRQLRRDAGKGKDVKAQDRVDIRDKRNAAEAAAFSQRLSDVQTAEQLGRMSHTAYMRYLQNEHNRLSAIGKRTRQQQDELNQIDQLMLDAKKEMSGAFNIGNIKLPTPYEVRKYVQEQAGLGVTDKRVTQSTTQVYIDGADVGMVKRVISQTVGKNAQVMTVSPRRI